VVPHQFVSIQGGLALRIQQFLNGGLIPLGDPLFQFIPGRAETGAPHQVGHQGYFLVSHSVSFVPKICS
jgi:hypothetical protein